MSSEMLPETSYREKKRPALDEDGVVRSCCPNNDPDLLGTVNLDLTLAGDGTIEAYQTGCAHRRDYLKMGSEVNVMLSVGRKTYVVTVKEKKRLEAVAGTLGAEVARTQDQNG